MTTFVETRVKELELADALSAWFGVRRGADDKARRASPVWRVMRDELRALGNWKNAARGNPRAGYRAMKERVVE